jgi:uncharacterized protein (DUF58 family)
VVYPRRVTLRPPALPQREFFGSPGKESPVQDPIYILGTRDYQHTQPARHIHWNASARHHRLQEKIFEPSQQLKVLLLLEVEQYALQGAADEFEQTLEVIAAHALQLDRQGCAFGLVTNAAAVGGKEPLLSVVRDPHQAPALLEILARLKMARREDLLTALARAGRLPRGISCVHFAHRPDALSPLAREYFRRRGIPLARVVSEQLSSSADRQWSGYGRIHRLAELMAGDA